MGMCQHSGPQLGPADNKVSEKVECYLPSVHNALFILINAGRGGGSTPA